MACSLKFLPEREYADVHEFVRSRTAEYKQAKDDNDRIYCEFVPGEDKLVAPVGKVMVKAVSPSPPDLSGM
jgi:hypothetical protein